MGVARFGLIFASFLFGIPAFAQDFPVVDWGPIIQTEAMNSAIDAAAREGAPARASRTPRATVRRPAANVRDIRQTLSQSLASQTIGQLVAATSVSGRYTPQANVRQKLATIMADAAARQDADKGAEMRKLVLSGEAVGAYERAAPRLGYRANDAVDAYAFYLLAQWGVANDHRADFTPAQAAGVRRQAAAAYAGIADQLPTDALRQQFGEMLVVQGAILAGVHESAVARGDAAIVSQAVQLARRGGAAVFTMNPVGIALTDAGFRRK